MNVVFESTQQTVAAWLVQAEQQFIAGRKQETEDGGWRLPETDLEMKLTFLSIVSHELSMFIEGIQER